jgi:hypothetical protein
MSTFRKVERDLPTDQQLVGKRIYFALYSDGLMGEAKLIVDRELAEIVDCGAPLDAMLASFRRAILDSARSHGNKTAPRA